MAPHISLRRFSFRLCFQSRVGAELIDSIAFPGNIRQLALSVTDPFAIQRIRGQQASLQHGAQILFRSTTAAARVV